MKIILSHDVDHLFWSEHYFKDWYIPARLFRNIIGLVTGKISMNLFLKRLKMWGRMHRIPELIAFYKERNIQAHFFFGMNNALRLSYPFKNAQEPIRLLLEAGHHVGVHGIETRKIHGITQEQQRFQNIAGKRPSGIRTHYLRWTGFTYALVELAGYSFDSSMEGLMMPFKVGKVWELPINLMDVSLVANAQNNENLEEWEYRTNKILKEAEEMGLPYFVLNFHDVYFDEQFPTMRNWYIRTIDKLFSQYTFTTFEEAISDLDQE